MATVAATTSDISINGASGKAKLFTWAALTTTNTVGSAVSLPSARDVTYQITGTFGAAATFKIEGSNDGTNWFTLSNRASTAIGSLTAAGGGYVSERPLYYRPNIVSGGDGSTSVTVSIFASGD